MFPQLLSAYARAQDVAKAGPQGGVPRSVIDRDGVPSAWDAQVERRVVELVPPDEDIRWCQAARAPAQYPIRR